MTDMNDDIFKALADANRRRIVSALCVEPMVAGQLGRLVGLAPNAVSFHLKLLQTAGLVTVRRQGRFLRYQVNADVLTQWREDVASLFSVGLSSKQRVEHLPVPPVPPFDRDRFATRQPSSPVEVMPAADVMPMSEIESAIESDADEWTQDKLPTTLL